MHRTQGYCMRRVIASELSEGEAAKLRRLCLHGSSGLRKELAKFRASPESAHKIWLIEVGGEIVA